MKVALAAIFLFIVPTIHGSDLLKDVFHGLDLIERIERLSREKRYGDIYDGLSRDYRESVPRHLFVKKSEELGWTLVDAQIGTLAINGELADAPVRGTTKIGRNILRIDVVAYLVKEDGEWRFWNFPFVPSHLLDRPYWPPPWNKSNLPVAPARGKKM